MGRNFGVRPSQLLGVEHDAAAFDFDLAATVRLLYYDLEARKEQAAHIINLLGKALNGGGNSGAGGAPAQQLDYTNAPKW